MRRLTYLDTARDDLVAILRHIAHESASVAIAEAFTGALRAKAQQLADLSGTLGTPRPELGDDLRSTPCRGYTIFFRYRADVLEVVTVVHASRDVSALFEED